MHYHCEIIIPPTDDVQSAIESIMAPFSENSGDEDHDRSNAFWDFYVIGGRSAGAKLLAGLDKETLERFNQWCQDDKITVSGVQCGKQELSPADQVEKVDAMWNELFPPKDGVLTACPMFAHSNDRYDSGDTIAGDICSLADAKDVRCARVIIAGPSFEMETGKRTGPLEPVFMLTDSAWNGFNHMDIKWDGTVGDSLSQLTEKFKHYKDEYREQMTPADDWLVVTVDYHS